MNTGTCNRPMWVEDWIAKARQKFGTKYNYGKAIFGGCYDKIIIICPEHGEFNQSPYGHIRTLGCQKCRTDKNNKNKWKCEKCNEYNSADLCRSQSCVLERKQARTRNKHKRLNGIREKAVNAVICNVTGCNAGTLKNGKLKSHSHCKGCDVVIYGNRPGKKKAKRFCAPKCKQAYSKRTRRFTTNCVVCEKVIERRTCDLEHRDTFCCSLECQRQHSFVDNRGCPNRLPDEERSRRAKVEWKKKSQLKRKAKYKGCCRALTRLITRDKTREQECSTDRLWIKVIGSRIGMKRSTTWITPKYKKRKSGLNGAINQLNQRVAYLTRDPWRNKISNKLSGVTQRLKRKSKNEANISSSKSTRETTSQSVQMCFDWVEA